MQVRWMEIRAVVIIGGIALLLAAVVDVVVASRNRCQPLPPPDVPVAASPAEVRVKAVERKPGGYRGYRVRHGCHRYAKQSSAELIAEGAIS